LASFSWRGCEILESDAEQGWAIRRGEAGYTLDEVYFVLDSGEYPAICEAIQIRSLVVTGDQYLVGFLDRVFNMQLHDYDRALSGADVFVDDDRSAVTPYADVITR